MRSILIISISLLVAACSTAQTKVKVQKWRGTIISDQSSLYGRKKLKGLPIMDFKVRMVDFGKLKKGDTRNYRYEFTNKGDAELKISLISHCDCTTSDLPKNNYKPGESGYFDIVFDSKDKDVAEIINIDVILENELPENGAPIIERVQYKFDIIK